MSGASITSDAWFGGAVFQVGPRISALYARRRFEARGLPFQDLFTFSPGLEVASFWHYGSLSVGVEGRVHYLRYATEAEDRSLGFGEAYLSIGVTP